MKTVQYQELESYDDLLCLKNHDDVVVRVEQGYRIRLEGVGAEKFWLSSRVFNPLMPTIVLANAFTWALQQLGIRAESVVAQNPEMEEDEDAEEEDAEEDMDAEEDEEND